MNNKSLATSACIVIIIALSIALFSVGRSLVSTKSDLRRIKAEHTHSIGKYLYVGKDGCLHRDGNCWRISGVFHMDDKDATSVKFIDTLNIRTHHFEFVCKDCFNDEQYEHLMAIIKHNMTENEDNTPPSRRRRNTATWIEE